VNGSIWQERPARRGFFHLQNSLLFRIHDLLRSTGALPRSVCSAMNRVLTKEQNN